MLLLCVVASTLWTSTAGSTTANRLVTYQGLVFSVPRTWQVVSASSGKCLGSRPTVVVGNYTSFSPTECSDFDASSQPSVVIDTLGPPPVGIYFNKQRKTLNKTSHGVHYTVTYGRGTFGIALNGKPAAIRGFAAVFTGSPVSFLTMGPASAVPLI